MVWYVVLCSGSSFSRQTSTDSVSVHGIGMYVPRHVYMQYMTRELVNWSTYLSITSPKFSNT